jgi:acyl carrier protein
MSVTRNEITERLNKVFKEFFSEDVEIFDSMKAGDVEDWDSVTHVILVVAVEKEFGLS